jgi:hypothetical protein
VVVVVLGIHQMMLHGRLLKFGVQAETAAVAVVVWQAFQVDQALTVEKF